MIPLTLAQLAEVVGGDLADDGDGDRQVTGVSIDSRRIAPGDLFVPLPGEHVDGHRYVADAMAAGAAGHLLGEAWEPTAPGAVVVDDPLDALTGLGAWLRDEVDPVVVAVTGSNGKTTTKDLIAAAVGAARRVVANPGSYNNELGVPLTLCRLTADTEVLVSEIGSRGRGHIALFMPLLRPDVAVVTSVAGAHLSEFGTVEEVAEAKAELIEGLDPDGVAVLNHDNPHVRAMADRAPGEVVTFGLQAGADLAPTAVELDARAHATLTVDGVVVRVPLPGLHHAANALAALAAARAVGVDLATAAEGLAAATVSHWRMEVTTTAAGVTVVNDAYNANPASVRAALETLAAMQVPGRRFAALGHMAELGATETAGHLEVGELAAAAGLAGLVVVEPRAAAIADGARRAGFQGEVLPAATVDEAVAVLAARLEPGDAVLVKASRSAGLERLVAGLLGGGAA